MTPINWKQHALDILKGALAAVAVAAGTALIQYLGANIPQVVSFIAQVCAATAGVKAGH